MTQRARLSALHADQLRDLPPTCTSCELGAGVRPGVQPDGALPTWARVTQQLWGQVGVAWHDGETIGGYLLFCPPLHVPRHGPQSGAPRTPDAVALLSIRVVEGYARAGVGRQLVQAAAARVVRLGPPWSALEVRANRIGASCALPAVDFLEAVGFQVAADHPLHPQLRLDLGRTVRWRRLTGAIDRLGALVRPVPPPEPAGGSTPQTAARTRMETLEQS